MPHIRVPRSPTLVAGAVLLALIAPTPPAAAAEPDYPAYDSRYHTNAEMVAEIHAAEAAYPDLVDVRSIGRDTQGRDIWVAKVSDNVAIDEEEPEVLVDAHQHARERLTVEQALYPGNSDAGLHHRPSRPRRGRLARDLDHLPVNPDGDVYDLGGTGTASGARTASPTPARATSAPTSTATSATGGAAAAAPRRTSSSETYRGPSAFSAPERRPCCATSSAAGVSAAQQQIKASIDFHTYGELVLWPFGYTTADTVQRRA